MTGEAELTAAIKECDDVIWQDVLRPILSLLLF